MIIHETCNGNDKLRSNIHLGVVKDHLCTWKFSKLIENGKLSMFEYLEFIYSWAILVRGLGSYLDVNDDSIFDTHKIQGSKPNTEEIIPITKEKWRVSNTINGEILRVDVPDRNSAELKVVTYWIELFDELPTFRLLPNERLIELYQYHYWVRLCEIEDKPLYVKNLTTENLRLLMRPYVVEGVWDI